MWHTLKVWLLYCGIIPFVLSIFSVMFMSIDINMTITCIAVLIIGGLLIGILAAGEKNLPTSFSKRYFPIAFPVVYTLVLWSIFMLISGGFYGGNAWGVFVFLHPPFLPVSFIASLYGIGILFFLAPLSYNSGFLLGFLLRDWKQRSKIIINKRHLLSFVVVLIVAISVGATVQSQRSKTVLPSYGFEYGGGYSSTDLWPYDVINPDNILPTLTEPATFTITNKGEMLVLDGAEAAFPVYSAFAQATYNDVNKEDIYGRFVTFSNTIYAYEQLLNREVDIYFGAEPSAEQLKMAEDSGRELVMTPIGKEAFVFFVNQNNKVNSLKVAEIKDIYSGKIKNWKELGGKSGKIIAFQRPKNSGSQTLLEKIMQETPLLQPLKEEVPRGMGGIMEQVADYRNYENAIGFSFRFFATGMNKNTDIKLLAIDDIEPNADNISSGIYPFTANLYAITLKDNKKPTIQPFLDWMQGPQGQYIVEEVGYVKMAE